MHRNTWNVLAVLASSISLAACFSGSSSSSSSSDDNDQGGAQPFTLANK